MYPCIFRWSRTNSLREVRLFIRVSITENHSRSNALPRLFREAFVIYEWNQIAVKKLHSRRNGGYVKILIWFLVCFLLLQLVFAFVLAVVNAAPAPAPAPYEYIAPASYSYQSSFVHHPSPVVKTYVAHPAAAAAVLPIAHSAPLVKTYPAYVPTYSHSLYPLAYKAPLLYAPHY